MEELSWGFCKKWESLQNTFAIWVLVAAGLAIWIPDYLLGLAVI